jgi:hypothetical protein
MFQNALSFGKNLCHLCYLLELTWNSNRFDAVCRVDTSSLLGSSLGVIYNCQPLTSLLAFCHMSGMKCGL